VIAEHYLKRWRDAGLIDDSAVARIGAWEAQHRRPIWLPGRNSPAICC
jgi:hypothetical protein